MKVLVAAAGTGGHINPALAIVNKIKEERPESKIVFIGTKRGLENELVTRAGYELRHIEAYGFKKEISLENMKKLFKTFFSYFKVRKIIEEIKPDIVIGAGGYICVPTFMASIHMKIPSVLHESNAHPGMAVKLFDKKATKILLGFEDTKKKLNKPEKAEVVGNPTNVFKKEISEEEKINILKGQGLDPKLPLIVVTGGSQGAKKINDTLLEYIISKNEMIGKDFQILWATGKAQYEEIVEQAQKEDINLEEMKGIKVVPYIYNMSEVLNVAQMAICRSGAMTITELGILGIPAIFVPLPSRNANRQIDNAKVFEDRGAALIIENEELRKEKLKSVLEKLYKKGKIKDLEENAEKYSKQVNKNEKKCVEKIYDIISRIVEEGQKEK